MGYLTSLINVVLDRTPEELAGALLIALGVSLLMAGLYSVRKRKAGDTQTLVVVLMLAASVLSMTVAAAYVARASERLRDGMGDAIPAPGDHGPGHANRTPGAGGRRGFAGGPGPGHLAAQRLLNAGDEDADGRLSPEEAARFVEAADRDGAGSIDLQALEAALRRHREGPPDAARPAPEPPSPPGSG